MLNRTLEYGLSFPILWLIRISCSLSKIYIFRLCIYLTGWKQIHAIVYDTFPHLTYLGNLKRQISCLLCLGSNPFNWLQSHPSIFVLILLQFQLQFNFARYIFIIYTTKLHISIETQEQIFLLKSDLAIHLYIMRL